MKVGIIICTYNNASHIVDTIRSVKAQEFTDWTCLIVDNGSTDETVYRAESEVRLDDRFELFRKNNEGPSAGRNYGYRRCPADIEYLHFLDGDDMLKPDFFSKMVTYLDQHPEVGLLGCQFEVMDEAGNYVAAGYRSRYAPKLLGFPGKIDDQDYETPFETFFASTGQGPFAVFRNRIYRQTKGYEEAFWSHEDSDIFCQMSLLAAVHYLPERLYIKRVHGHNLTGSSKADYSKFRNKWDFFTSPLPEVNQKIEKALRYYYGIHVPLRDFKVAVMAAKEFAKDRRKHSLQWCLHCVGNGLANLFLKRALRKRLKERKRELQPATS